jgi:hypothetical protein
VKVLEDKILHDIFFDSIADHPVDLTIYKIKLNVEGGKSLELDLNKEQFDKLSVFCDQVLPDRKWKIETLKPVEA